MLSWDIPSPHVFDVAGFVFFVIGVFILIAAWAALGCVWTVIEAAVCHIWRHWRRREVGS